MLKYGLKYNRRDSFFYSSVLFFLLFFEFRTFFSSMLPITILTSVCIGLYLLCFLFMLYKKRKIVFLTKFDKINMFFFLLLGFRLIYDIFIIGIEQNVFMNRYTFLVYYLFLIIIPYLISINLPMNRINIRFVLMALIYFLGFGLFLSLNNILSAISSGFTGYLGRYNANEALDTIGYGHLALTCFILCFVVSNSPEWRGGIIMRITILLLMIFSLFSIVVANSRSPLLALILVLLVFYYRRLNLKLLIVLFMISTILFYSFDDIDLYLKNTFNSSFTDRIVATIEDKDSSGRDVLYSLAFKSFLEHPVLGSSLLISDPVFQGDYPHNFFLETLMSLGIIGGILYLFSIFLAFKYSFYLIKRNSPFLIFALLFIQYFVYSMFSRSLITLPMYWVILALISVSYKYERLQQKNENCDSNSLL